MLSVAVVGASGYAGAELCRIFSAHNEVCLRHLYVSENSLDKNKMISDLYGSLRGRCDLVLEPMSDPKSLIGEVDAVFLATDHKVSHDVAPVLTSSGIAVFDLSGAFRISDLNVFAEAYI